MEKRPRRAAITGDGGLLRQIIEAATEGSVDLLDDVMKEDRRILDKVVLGFLSSNPLHTAAWCGHVGFVEKLLQLNLTLARGLDSMGRTALHLASTRGHVAVVRVLMEKAPEMCLARDRDGRNPIQVAALNGKVDVLEVLVEARPRAARARLEQDETILHLCVNLNELQCLQLLLKMIDDKEFVNARDCEGNTILHLAIIGKRFEIVEHLIPNEQSKIQVNARNAKEHTAKDLLKRTSSKVGEISRDEMIEHLDKANAEKGSVEIVVQEEWINRNRGNLMVVISLIATIAFQAGVSPPGGIWQDNTNGHTAGEAVMAYEHPYWLEWYLCCSTFGFIASLTTLLLLNKGFSTRNIIYRWVLVVVMILTITFVVATSAISVFWVTPKRHRDAITAIIAPALVVFFIISVCLLLLHTRYFVVIFIKSLKSLPRLTVKVFNVRKMTEFLRNRVLPKDRAETSEDSDPDSLL